MLTFDDEPTEINAFKIGDTSLFKHCFDNQDVFGNLETFYSRDEHWFDIPEEKLAQVQQLLDKHYCKLHVIEDTTPYTVFVDNGTNYSEMLRSAVVTKEQSNCLLLLLKDELSVEQAIEQGASRLGDTDINEEL